MRADGEAEEITDTTLHLSMALHAVLTIDPDHSSVYEEITQQKQQTLTIIFCPNIACAELPD
jgi:hypothetical protein